MVTTLVIARGLESKGISPMVLFRKIILDSVTEIKTYQLSAMKLSFEDHQFRLLSETYGPGSKDGIPEMSLSDIQ